MSDSEERAGLRLCVGGPFDGQWKKPGVGTAWPIRREDGSVAWYRVDPDDPVRAIYAGAAPPEPDASSKASRARQEEAAAEELEREQDSAT